MNKNINKSRQHFRYKTAFLVLFFVITIPISKADYSIIYNNEALFEKGLEAYHKNKHRDAASYLFAYIQRNPSQMETKPTHRRQVLNAVKFAIEGANLPAGTIGMVRPPPLEKIQHLPNDSVQPRQIGLLNLLTTKHWKEASKFTWKLIVDNGDKNGDGRLNYHENDNFPCSTLKRLSGLWKKHYGSSSGFADVLIPRFHQRFISCKIWLR